MSDLYRSALSARIAKLPDLPPGDEDDEGEEAADSIGSLPGSGMGPPAMQVEFSDPSRSAVLNYKLKGQPNTHDRRQIAHLMPTFLPSLQHLSLPKQRKSRFLHANWMFESTIPHLRSRKEQL